MIHWEEPKEKEDKKQTFWYYTARSTDIEQTAYALIAKLTLTGKKTTSDNIPIVKWLSKQRNGLGGWSSTQVNFLCFLNFLLFWPVLNDVKNESPVAFIGIIIRFRFIVCWL